VRSKSDVNETTGRRNLPYALSVSSRNAMIFAISLRTASPVESTPSSILDGVEGGDPPPFHHVSAGISSIPSRGAARRKASLILGILCKIVKSADNHAT